MDDIIPSQRCYLWVLPQELLDVIFDLAYQRPYDLEVIFKKDLGHDNEWSKDLVGYIPAVFPKPKVNDFLISKRFFIAAARAGFSSDRWIDRNQMVRSLFGIRTAGSGLFVQFAREMETSGSHRHKAISSMSGLRVLDIVVDEFLFYPLGLPPKKEGSGTHHLEEAEVSELSMVSTIGTMIGLKSLTLSIDWIIYSPDEQKEVFKGNFKTLEHVLRDRIQAARVRTASETQPPTSTSSSSHVCSPFYYRSRVCFGRSRLESFKQVRFKAVRGLIQVRDLG